MNRGHLFSLEHGVSQESWTLAGVYGNPLFPAVNYAPFDMNGIAVKSPVSTLIIFIAVSPPVRYPKSLLESTFVDGADTSKSRPGCLRFETNSKTASRADKLIRPGGNDHSITRLGIGAEN